MEQRPRKSSAKKTPRLQTNVLGDYRLLSKLGAGGMGTVYKAHQISLDRPVALKVLSRELAANQPTLVQRFLREARVMAKLDHPNILRCYEVNQFQGLHYLTMEYIDGGSVQQRLKKLGRFTIGDAVHIVLACADALQHAHEQNLIHRDVKPENVLLTKKGVVKVADLGLAKALDENQDLTRTGMGAGTPAFMAPEQARDVKNVDRRSDIYSLGIMLYCLLTGKVPFEGETMVDLFQAKSKGIFTPSRKYNQEVPPHLDLVIDKLLAAKPEHRFPSCTELIEALEELNLANEYLSFASGANDAAARRKTTASFHRLASGPPRTVAPGSTGGRFALKEEAPLVDHWYVQLETPGGEILIKKVNDQQLIGMIKHGTVDAKTKISRSQKTGWRGVGTVKEFTSLTKAKAITQQADMRGQVYRDLYAKIEKQEKRRLLRRWWVNLFFKAGGAVGLVLRLVILAAAGVGIFFLLRWGLTELFKRLGYA